MRAKPKNAVKGFQVLENECIWMKAGVIDFKLCESAYDCSHCPFDKIMTRKSAAGPVAPEWTERLREKYSGTARPCRHRLTGRVEAPKICVQNYECHHCAYDQMLDDIDEYQLGHRPRTILAGGFSLARDYYYHPGHSWVRIEHGGRSRIGMDDFAVRLFGASRRLDLPRLGAVVEQNRVAWVFERGNKAAAVLSPITGTVLAVNYGVLEHPEILHEAPYDAGWLLMVEPERPKKDLRQLYFGDQSRKWMEADGQRLLEMVGFEYERLSATGGRVVADVFGSCPRLKWEDLARTFLRTEVLEGADERRPY